MRNRLVWLQFVLPQHLLSRIMGGVARSRCIWFKNLLIRWFIRRYDVNVSESEKSPLEYSTFNEFFTRALKAGARPFSIASDCVVSPADSAISQYGCLTDGNLIQAKGKSYTVGALLGDMEIASQFKKSSFMTLYLSPKDYHRVHMPLEGRLLSMKYVPGRLFSVNPATTQAVNDLFARNERVVCLFETSYGPMAVILVGAFFVASIEMAFAGIVAPGKAPVLVDYSQQSIQFTKGQEIGRFQFGSTVIVLLPSQFKFLEWQLGQSVKFGETLATVEEK